MKGKLFRKITGLVLAVAMTLSLAPVKAEAQVNNSDSLIYKYTDKGNTAWSQQITLKDGEFYAIKMIPDIDQTWTFESKGNDDTYLKMSYREDENDINSLQVIEQDEGGETSGNFKLTHDLKAGHVYLLYISGYADFACTTTVYGTPVNTVSFKALSDQVMVLSSPYSTDTGHPSECTLEIGLQTQDNQSELGFVQWYYLDEGGKEVYVSGDYFKSDERTAKLKVAYNKEMNGRTVTYIAKCSSSSYEQEIQFQVGGTSFDSGLKISSWHCPDYVAYNEEAILSVGVTGLVPALEYEWYYLDPFDDYVLIEDATENTYVVPAKEYFKTGPVQYKCIVNDGYSEAEHVFTFNVNPENFYEQWSISADHEYMKPGETNHLHVSASVDNLSSYTVQWYRWLPANNDYAYITGADDFTYEITAKESAGYQYGDVKTYKCVITNSNHMVVSEQVIQVGISAIRDDQLTESYYFDSSMDQLIIKTTNCKLADPSGNYTYEWTIEGDDNSYISTPKKLDSNESYCILTADDFKTEGEYAVSCRIFDHAINKSVATRAFVYFSKSDHYYLYYDSKAVMDYQSGTDLQVVAVLSEEYSDNELTYQWYKNGIVLSGETGSSMHISPAAFSLTDTYKCHVSDGAQEEDCTFSIFNSKPVISGQEPSDDSIFHDCEWNWSLSKQGVTTTSCEIAAKTNYVFSIGSISEDDPNGVYEICITGKEKEDYFDFALYDDRNNRMNIAYGVQNGGAWIRFEHTGSNGYKLLFKNRSGTSVTRTISINPYNAMGYYDDKLFDVVGAGSTYRSIYDHNPIGFNWTYYGEYPEAIRTRFYVDGRLVVDDYNLDTFVPDLKYDLDHDGVLNVTFRITDGSYWYETSRIIYYKTIFWENETGDREVTANISVKVAKNQEIDLSYEDLIYQGPYGVKNIGKIKNAFDDLTSTWYYYEDPDDYFTKNLTKVGTEATCKPDTKELGTYYYLVEISNGVDTCNMFIKLQVVDHANLEEGKTNVHALSLSLFDTGLLNLNVYLRIPASDLAVGHGVDINGKNVDEYEYAGTFFDSNVVYSIYKIMYPITPAELGTNQRLLVRDYRYETILDTNVTGRDYLDLFLNDSTFLSDSSELNIYSKLVKSLARYGDAAKDYFNHQGDVSIIDVLTDSDRQIQEVSDAKWEGYKITDENLPDKKLQKVPLIDYFGSSLLLKEGTSLRHYFVLDDSSNIRISNYTFTCDGVPLTPVKKGSLYYIDITDIPVYNLSKAYRIEVKTGEGRIVFKGSFDYSVMNYLYNWHLKDLTITEKNLINSLYDYGHSWPYRRQ